jgi:hypothetical protein
VSLAYAVAYCHKKSALHTVCVSHVHTSIHTDQQLGVMRVCSWGLFAARNVMYASSVLKVFSLPARQDNKNRCSSALWSLLSNLRVQSYLIQSLYTTGQSVKTHFNASVEDGWLWWSTTLATQIFEPQPHSFLSVGSHR